MEKLTAPILGVPISTFGMERALGFCAAQAKAGQGGYVCFANVHTVTESQDHPGLFAVMKKALLALADGLPLVWTSRIRGPRIESRVCGPDFMAHFLERNRDVQSGFIGGKPGQAERLAEHFGLESTCYSPPMRPFSESAAREDWQEFLRRNDGKPLPKVVWIGLGAPKQELWMGAVADLAPNVVFFGVGAAFDFLTGTKKRAPLWMQKSGLEWLFRLVQEPGRLWRRYFVTNSRYLAYLTLDLLRPAPVLSTQLILTLFFPPIGVGSRSMYLGDLWFYAWVPLLTWKVYRADRARARRMLRWVAGAAIVFGLSYLHGYFRPSLATELAAVNLTLTEPDTFAPIREGVVASRFFIWFWAAALLAHLRFDRVTLVALSRVFAWVIIVASVTLLGAKFMPDLHAALGRVYGYDPNAFPWAGRIYGTFRSPIESGISLGFASMILLALPREIRPLSRLAFVTSVAGVFVSRTFTAFVAGIAAASAILVSRLGYVVRILLGLGAVAAVTVFTRLASESGFAREKMIDFVYRFGPWKVYLIALVSRIDHLVFGFGNANYHVDNSYLFLFSRGGLLLLGFVGWAGWRATHSRWREWNSTEKAIVAYFLISGLVIDTVIVRPVVALLITMAVPLLARKTDE